MKILITGAHGFLGTWVYKILKNEQYALVAFEGDICKKDSLPKEEFDAVIHLAALITHRSTYTYENLYQVNVTGTMNMLDTYSNAKFVFASTTDVTRDKLSGYAETKLQAEGYVQKRSNTLIIRLPSIFGPEQRQRKLIPLLFKKYCQNSKCTIKNDDMREYIYVEDAAKKIISNIWENGIITLYGTKIRNTRLEMLIRIACKQDYLPNLSNSEQEFYFRLKECVPSYLKRKS